MQSSNFPAIVAACVAALLWGLWWLPVRSLVEAGLTGWWAGTAILICAMPAILAAILINRPHRAPDIFGISGAILIGLAIAGYSLAIAETTVVRAVLLFYLAPVWTLTIECVWQGRKFNRLNGIAIFLAMTGILFVFRGNISGAAWQSGDFIALASGAFWAAGATMLVMGRESSASVLALVSAIVAILVGAAIALLLEPFPRIEMFQATFQIAFWGGTLYAAPILIATIWSARLLGATTVTFILTGEIIVGIVSVALLESEPFGWPELLGTTMILSATLIEVLQPRMAR